MRPRLTAPPNNRLWHFSFRATGLLFLTAFAIVATFFVIHEQRLDQSLARSELINELIFSGAELDVNTDHSDLRRRAQSLMELDDYLSVTLVDEQAKKIFEVGLPLSETELTSPYKTQDRWQHDERLFVVHTISSSSSTDKTPQAWLITTIDKTRVSLVNLQFLLISALVLFAIGIVSLFYHKKLNRDVFIPLEDLNERLSKQNTIREISSINFNYCGVLEELVQQINESIKIQLEKETDLRTGIENATQELRESLETVEVHNIDLDMARKNAVELNNLKSEFLKKTSQDLRTPLSGIMGFADLIKKTPLTTEQKDYINTIEESTKGMLTIISDIHDFSRLESGNLQVDKKLMALRRCIEETLTLQAPIANEHEVTLYSTIDQDVPESVFGDALRIQQVLANLVSNAIKFEHASYIEACVHAANKTATRVDLKIAIHTDGQCPYEFKSWQNQPEDKNSDSKQFYSGAGMGLSIAKGIAQHMHGKVDFTVDEDTCSFTFTLSLDINEQQTQLKSIDSANSINALVFSNSDIGYREVTSRLVELGIKNQRAQSFSEILSIAQKLKQTSLKHARYMPLAIIEAQTSQQTLDKIVLTQTLRTIVDELEIPTVVIAPMGKHETLQKVLKGIDVYITQHPLVTPKFRKGIIEQLGIVKWKYENTPSKNSASTAPMQILIVDDNAANLKLATALLGDFNATITTAETGAQAINAFKQSPFDLIFMDIQLPDFDGFETTTRIRTIEAESSANRTPIVALTAHNVADEKTRLLLAGMDDFVGKPLTIKDIGTIIDRWVIGAKIKSTASVKQQASPIQIDTARSSTDDSNTPAINQKSNEDSTIDSSPVNIADCLALTRNDPALAKDMLSMLLQSLPEEINHIEDTYQNKDFQQLYSSVHKLHGACCYCGVPSLKYSAKNLDLKLKNGETAIEEDFNAVVQASKNLLEWQQSHDLDALFDS